jgi:hypothetical protein
VRAARKGSKAKFRTITQTKTMKLGSVTYDIPGSTTQRPSVTLSNAAYKVLEEASGHKWSAIVSNTPTVGTFTGKALRMTGPVPSQVQNTTKKTGGSVARKTTK